MGSNAAWQPTWPPHVFIAGSEADSRPASDGCSDALSAAPGGPTSPPGVEPGAGKLAALLARVPPKAAMGGSQLRIACAKGAKPKAQGLKSYPWLAVLQ